MISHDIPFTKVTTNGVSFSNRPTVLDLAQPRHPSSDPGGLHYAAGYGRKDRYQQWWHLLGENDGVPSGKLT